MKNSTRRLFISFEHIIHFITAW